MVNEEIKNIVEIMGLQYNMKYTELRTLCYGRLMNMADQDQDGSHTSRDSSLTSYITTGPNY